MQPMLRTVGSRQKGLVVDADRSEKAFGARSREDGKPKIGTNQTYFLRLVRLVELIRVARCGGVARNEDGDETVAGAG